MKTPTSLSTILSTIIGALTTTLALLAGSGGHIEHATTGNATIAGLVGVLSLAAGLLIHPHGTPPAPAAPAPVVPESARTPDGAVSQEAI